MVTGTVIRNGTRATVVFTSIDYHCRPSRSVELVRVSFDSTEYKTARAALIVALRAALDELEG